MQNHGLVSTDLATDLFLLNRSPTLSMSFSQVSKLSARQTTQGCREAIVACAVPYKLRKGTGCSTCRSYGIHIHMFLSFSGKKHLSFRIVPLQTSPFCMTLRTTLQTTKNTIQSTKNHFALDDKLGALPAKVFARFDQTS